MYHLFFVLTIMAAVVLPAGAGTLAPTDAAAHVGEYVAIVGDVATARIEGDLFLLDFAGVDPAVFRAVLVVPMISGLPTHPDRVYNGRRVQISGPIRRFRGRTEMVLQSPGQIEIVDLAGAPDEEPTTTSTTTTSTTARPGAAPTVPTPTLAPATLPPLPPPVLPTPAAPLAPRVDPCPGAQAHWRDARDAVRRAMRTLDDCLSGDRHQCRREAAALAPALSTLEWSEQGLADACP